MFYKYFKYINKNYNSLKIFYYCKVTYVDNFRLYLLQNDSKLLNINSMRVVERLNFISKSSVRLKNSFIVHLLISVFVGATLSSSVRFERNFNFKQKKLFQHYSVSNTPTSEKPATNKGGSDPAESESDEFSQEERLSFDYGQCVLLLQVAAIAKITIHWAPFLSLGDGFRKMSTRLSFFHSLNSPPLILT